MRSTEASSTSSADVSGVGTADQIFTEGVDFIVHQTTTAMADEIA
jgi:hypothetical protein